MKKKDINKVKDNIQKDSIENTGNIIVNNSEPLQVTHGITLIPKRLNVKLEPSNEIKIKIINKANEQFEIYKKKYGTTKTFVAEKLGVSRQHLYTILVSDSITLENAIKLAIVFECKLDDIVSYEILS